MINSENADENMEWKESIREKSGESVQRASVTKSGKKRKQSLCSRQEHVRFESLKRKSLISWDRYIMARDISHGLLESALNAFDFG